MSAKEDGTIFKTHDFLFMSNQLRDNVELRLSALQQEIFNGWRRPENIFHPLILPQDDMVPGTGLTMKAQGGIDLVQDVTSDCSVVASLCAVTVRTERGHSNLISSIIYPYDHKSMEPVISSSGKYIFRLHFNGCFRKVVIDDRLPSSHTSQALHVVDRNNSGLLWPALIEKAYLKIRGGYDFPGSNSGTDLWVLTGWIPEQLFLQRDESSPDVLWHRVFTAFKYGDVLITIGTGRLNEREEQSTGLVGEHDYAIIDMEETEGRRLFLVKNPWSEGTTWKGGLNNKSGSINNRGGLTVHGPGNSNLSLSKESRLTPGTFWMGLSDVFQSFESMYLNWNPGLLSFREDIHFTWDLALSRSPGGSFASNPQFEIRSTLGGSVWLLLSRHFKTISPVPDDDASEPALMLGTDHGFISLYAFDRNGEKVFLSDGAKIRGTYVDSPNTLVKLELPSGSPYTVVVSEQDLPRSDYNFTLSAFSLHPLTINEARDKYTTCTLRKGAWTSTSSGGNASSALYYMNPQFSIRLPTASDVSLLLDSAEYLPVHVKLVWANGNAVTSITVRDIVGDSGEYRKGYAFAEISKVQAGTYTIVCSTFETGQLGTFTLRIGTMSGCTVERVFSAEAGRLLANVPTASFSPGVYRLLAPLVCHRITRVSVITRGRQHKSATMRGTASPLKLAVEYGQGSTKEILVVSGEDEFLEIQSGIRTKDIDIHPNMCDGRGLWVVVHRLGHSGPQNNEEVDVEVLSDTPVEVGMWGRGDD